MLLYTAFFYIVLFWYVINNVFIFVIVRLTQYKSTQQIKEKGHTLWNTSTLNLHSTITNEKQKNSNKVDNN